MLITVSSCRGAPGVSSWALTLATAWPGDRDRILVEADGSGGVMACRYDLPSEPGAANLISHARRGRLDDTLALDTVARRLRANTGRQNPGAADEPGLWVVPAPLAGHEALDAWRTMAVPTGEAMQLDHRVWFADCGRVWHGAPAEALLAMAPLNVLVADGSMPSLLVLRSRVGSIPNRVAIIVVGSMRYTTDELLQFTGADYVWNVPWANRLESLAADFATSGRARRTKLWRAALDITHTLATDWAPPAAAPLAQQTPSQTQGQQTPAQPAPPPPPPAPTDVPVEHPAPPPPARPRLSPAPPPEMAG